MTLTFDPMTLKTYSVHLLFIRRYTSSLVKIPQIPWEISCTQDFHIWPHMTLTFDPMTLKTYSVHLLFIGSYHVKFGEDPSNPLGDIALTGFSYMTPYDLELWPHELENLISSSTLYRELPRQVWWRSLKSLGRYRAHKIFVYDPIWPWPLTPWPWKPNQFIYSS